MSDKEIVLDEDSPLDEIFDVLTMTLEEIMDLAEKTKGDVAYALTELSLQAIDISLLLREKCGDVSIELDFDLEDGDYEPYERTH
jgi:hypothetical protein